MKIFCPRPLDDGAKLESFSPTMVGVEPTTSGNRTRTTLGTPGALIIKISLSTAPSNFLIAEIPRSGTVVFRSVTEPGYFWQREAWIFYAIRD